MSSSKKPPDGPSAGRVAGRTAASGWSSTPPRRGSRSIEALRLLAVVGTQWAAEPT